jgi:hypothetical protein
MKAKEITFRLESVCPLLMHNIQLANPLNKWSRMMKELSGKRKKTDSDFAEMSRIEWYGGLYSTKNDKGKDVVIIPSEVLLGCFTNGAKKSKRGTDFKCGFDVPYDAVLEYDGPKDIDKLWEDGRFVDVRAVCIQRSRVMRTRAIFMSWATNAVVRFDPDVLNESAVVKAVTDSGYLVGLCDYRPRFGRFMATKI